MIPTLETGISSAKKRVENAENGLAEGCGVHRKRGLFHRCGCRWDGDISRLSLGPAGSLWRRLQDACKCSRIDVSIRLTWDPESQYLQRGVLASGVDQT